MKGEGLGWWLFFFVGFVLEVVFLRGCLCFFFFFFGGGEGGDYVLKNDFLGGWRFWR